MSEQIVKSGGVASRRLPVIGVNAARVVTVLGLLLLGPFSAAQAQDDSGMFYARNAQTRLVDEVYRLDADLELDLSKPVRSALENGVPLVVEVQIQVLRRQSWVWDPVVAELAQRQRIQFHALSQRYVTRNLSTDLQHSDRSLISVLGRIGLIRDFPMLDRKLLEPGEHYYARIRVQLDIESLPTPIRLWAYASPQWRLTSEWYTWPLEP